MRSRRRWDRRATLVVAGRNAQRGEDTVTAITSAGGKASFQHCDLADRSSIKDVHARVMDQFGQVDVAVNAAGISGPLGKVPDIKAEDLDALFAVNITGFYLSMGEQIRAMASREDKKGGHIINLTSIYGLHGIPFGSAYVTSKHAVVGMTKSAAVEWAKHGIYINAIAPGVIPTAIVAGMMEAKKELPDEEEFDQLDLEGRFPVGRFGRPDDVAKAVAYLVENDWVVGTVLEVEGGYGAV